MSKLALIATCVAVLWFGVAAPAEPLPPDTFLSVEETVKLATTIYLAPLRKEEAARRRRGNPAARPALYAIIEDSQKKLYWDHVISYFEYIGQREDVAPLTRFIDSRMGLLETNESKAVTAVFRALAGMSARGIEEARYTLDAMIRRRYWKDRPFRIRDDKGNPEALDFENDMVLSAVCDRVSAREDDFPQIARSVLEEVDDPIQKRLMRTAIEAAIKSHAEYVREALDWGEPPAKQRRPLTPLAPGQTYQPPPVQAPKQPQPMRQASLESSADIAGNVGGIIEAALRAYASTRDALVNDDYPAAAKGLADNGKPMLGGDDDQALAEATRKLRALAEGTSQTKTLLAELKAANLKLGPAEIESITTAATREAARGAGKYQGLTLDHAIVVRIPYESSAALTRKHLPHHSPRHITLNDKRELVIYMIQKDGKWYWNPFGW